MKNNPSATLIFIYLRASFRELMVQKDDECIFIRAPIQFLFYLAVYDDEALPAELMSVTQVNNKV